MRKGSEKLSGSSSSGLVKSPLFFLLLPQKTVIYKEVPKITAVYSLVVGMSVKRKMTRKFLEDAFAGESMAHMKYLIFAEQAEREGFPNIAKLFRAIAYAEFVHAKNHFIALGKLGKTEENLEEAIAGETFEVEEMYPVYKNSAEFQGEREAIRTTHYALEAEKIHAELYEKARERAKSGEDMDVKKVYICPVCGYTSIDEVPERCPVCGAPGDKFVAFE